MSAQTISADDELREHLSFDVCRAEHVGVARRMVSGHSGLTSRSTWKSKNVWFSLTGYRDPLGYSPLVAGLITTLDWARRIAQGARRR